MLCNTCGTELKNGAAFCHICGAIVDTTTPPVSIETPPLPNAANTSFGQTEVLTSSGIPQSVPYPTVQNAGQTEVLTAPQPQLTTAMETEVLTTPPNYTGSTGTLSPNQYAQPGYPAYNNTSGYDMNSMPVNTQPTKTKPKKQKAEKARSRKTYKEKTQPWIYVLVSVMILCVIAAGVLIFLILGTPNNDSKKETAKESTSDISGQDDKTASDNTSSDKTASDNTHDKKDETTTAATTQEEAKAELSGRAYIEGTGWMDWMTQGKIIGTTGEKKRLEAFQIKIKKNGLKGGVTYRAYVEGKGWMDWVGDSELAGTKGESKRIEAIQVKLEGELAQRYDIYYCTYVQGKGWMDWAKNGEKAGTAGQKKRLEAIKISLIEKNGEAPGETKSAFEEASGNSEEITTTAAEPTTTDEPTTAATEEVKEEWAKAYMDYIYSNNLSDYAHYILIYLDNDSIPEIVLGEEDQGGAVLSYYNGSVSQLWLARLSSFSFMVERGLVLTSGGDNRGNEYEDVILLENGLFSKIGSGHRTYDISNMENHTYEWNNTPMSEEEYNANLSSLFSGENSIEIQRNMIYDNWKDFSELEAELYSLQ